MGTPGPALTVVIVLCFASSPYLIRYLIRPASRALWSRRPPVLRRPPQDRANRPIEEIAADVRTRGLKFHSMPTHASFVKQNALRSAYDLVLGECCASLGHEHLLGVVQPGEELDRERRRVELLLHSFGLPVADVA